MAGESSYHRAIFDARAQALAFSRDHLERLLALLQDFADELATREIIGLGSAAEAARLATVRELIDRLADAMAIVTAESVALTIDDLAEAHAIATLRLLEANGQAELFGPPAVGLANYRQVGLQAAATLVARPEISRAFRTIRRDGVPDVDAILLRAALRGAPTRTTAMELRGYILGAEAYPPEILTDRRRIGLATLRALGYPEPTPALVQTIRRETGKIAAKAQLIARTETMVAEHEGGVALAAASPVVALVEWFLSQRHKIVDVCDLLATVDWYGFGPGLYDPRQVPARPHPRCICGRRHRLRPPEEWGQPRAELAALRLDPFEVAAEAGRSPSEQAQLARAFGLGEERTEEPPAPPPPPEPLETRIFRAWQRAIDSDAVDPLRDFVADVGREMGGLDDPELISLGSAASDAKLAGGFFRGFSARSIRLTVGPGELHLGNPATRRLEAARLAGRLPSTAALRGSRDGFELMHELRRIIHEQNHAISWIEARAEGQPFFDKATAIAMEEGLVEERARRIIARLYGIDQREIGELYWQRSTGRGSYADFVEAMRIFPEEILDRAFTSDGTTRARIFGGEIRERHRRIFDGVRRAAEELSPERQALAEAIANEAEALFDPDGRVNDAFLVNEFFVGFGEPDKRRGEWWRLGIDQGDIRLFAAQPEALKNWLGSLTEALGYSWRN